MADHRMRKLRAWLGEKGKLPEAHVAAREAEEDGTEVDPGEAIPTPVHEMNDDRGYHSEHDEFGADDEDRFFDGGEVDSSGIDPARYGMQRMAGGGQAGSQGQNQNTPFGPGQYGPQAYNIPLPAFDGGEATESGIMAPEYSSGSDLHNANPGEFDPNQMDFEESRLAYGGYATGGRMAPGGGGRFAKLKGEIANEPGVKDPGAVAAMIGRKKYGSGKMQEMASKGRHRHALARALKKG